MAEHRTKKVSRLGACPIFGLLMIALWSGGCQHPREQVKVPYHDSGYYHGRIVRGGARDTNNVITVMVHGEIRNPGTLQVPRGSTILEVIKQAGGFTDFAYSKRIEIQRAGSSHRYLLRREWNGLNHYRIWYVPSRRNPDTYSEEPVDSTVKTDAVAEAGDRIIVLRSML